MPLPNKNRNFLAPEDAIHSSLSAQRQPATERSARSLCMPSQILNDSTSKNNSRKGGHRNKIRSTNSGRQKGSWKKLLWVKQSYPDNYTDQETFLEHLQRNPRLQPYDFWPLVADSTVIVQHVCSVIIFVVCFVGIFQEHVSPIAVVGWGSIATLLGWVLWDSWMEGGEEEAGKTGGTNSNRDIDSDVSSLAHLSSIKAINTSSSTVNLPSKPTKNLGFSTVANVFNPYNSHSHSNSISSITSITSVPRVSNVLFPSDADHYPNQFSHRTSRRLSTVKSALLIYFTLLGLSPILKSLTRSTSSDSIWTISFLLFTVNIFFFDYGPSVPSSSSIISSGGVSRKKNITASLSTNAALMASTVLASRLPSTGQVFSLTLFSIEVFGLFPVFRNDLRQRSWRGHVFLTSLLVLGAGGGVGLILSIRDEFSDSATTIAYQSYFLYKNFGLGMLLGVLLTALAMGGCSWWLIDLQKYKNEIHGPWDPARPVIRRAWNDEY
ncbi:putative phosphatidylinositol:udp- c transferase pig-c protein [Erysiphe neolycopersici]|uniref:Putative phosphatidylinositol:udp-c transferase pig-c protein n=1 Tax=Erysiphe neolycopersici TaxID=212602 RepID=A0A420I028_9PEZI|nr:putative phosphatidylinositol:udp- c transferase pig-c protein [Erysiphe neolycopersici]